MIERLFLARPRGFCAGVVMAIEAVERAAAENREQGRGDLAVYHSIVHNRTVVERLERDHEVHFVEDLGELEALRSDLSARGRRLDEAVVFSAHGVSPAVRREAALMGLSTIDATCPLVTKVHSEAKRYAAMGYHLLLVGDSPSHQEVIGTYGEAPEATTLVAVLGQRVPEGMADPRTVTVDEPDRVVVLTQTTLSVDDTERTIELLRRRFPNLVVPSRSDLCFATKNRQDAVRSIAPRVDLFLVLSSPHSSNGMRLFELAQDLTGNARRIESADELQPAWLDGVRSVGVSAAASTPEDLVQAVVSYFRRANPALQLIEEGEWEDIEFRAPRRVAAPGAAT